MPPPTTAPPQPTPAAPEPTRSPPAPGTPAPAAGLQATAGNAAVAGAAEEGGLRIHLGRGIQLSAAELEGGGRQVQIDLSARRPQPVPGLRLKRFTYDTRRRSGTLTADLDIPHVDNVRGGVTVRVDRNGEATLRARVAATRLGVFNNPRLSLGLDEQKNLSGSITIAPSNLTPRGLGRRLTVEGGGTVSLSEGRLSGDVRATLSYQHLGQGSIHLSFSETGQLSGDGHIELEQPYLQGVRAELAVREGNLDAEVNIPASSIRTPIPGLEVPEGNIHLTMHNHQPGGGVEGLKLRYPGFGEGTITANIANGQFTGNGSFAITVAQLTEVSGSLSYRNGVLTGSATVRSQDFPEALPVSGGSITATLQASGAVDFRGEVAVTLGPAGSGQLRAAYTDGQVSIGTTIDLNVPGLQGARFSIDYINGQLEGEGDVPIDTELLQGITGSVHVEYREGRWAGETELTYDADNGKLHGTVRVGVRQNEEGGLNVHGGGEVTAQIAPRLEGMLGVNIHEDGTIDISGAITVTEPLELFPEKREDKELFRISKNIPLWAILVAVIRVRGGVRAGIGPGVFRDIRVEGEYTIGGDQEPSFRITGEMFIPAFVEGYVAFGAGLGLDVVLGSLTGGIEAVASAGIYGAISVVPELAYENGDYSIDGTATLAAGARLKVGLNAWAEVEALWVTVWEQTWELAEWVWSIGPDLALQARMHYVFGHPEPPTLEFRTSDIDSERLIQDAMPKDGPPGSGAREAVQNRAEWQGATRRQGREANRVPGELQQQANQPTPAPPAPPRPQRPAPPQGANAPPGPGAARAPAGAAPPSGPGREARDARTAAQRPTGSEETRPASEIPGADRPRYPRPVTLATLNEPPAPMPRTHEQQGEDVEAAARCVRLAERQVESTEQLAEYFTRIKTRFRLSSIGFHALGRGRIGVRCTINPSIDEGLTEKMQGSGIAEAGVVLQTKVTYQAGTLGGETVGLRMEADPLGPDHPQGSPPGSGSQPRLMNQLVTDPSQSAHGRYIRGHLLNDNVGGPGTPGNLFPITAQANSQHESRIESRVKRWVNDQRYWVYYKVQVAVQQVSLGDTDKRKNKVDANFVATASILDTAGGKVNTVNVTITSTFQAPQPAPDVAETNPAFEAQGHQARQADLNAPAPALSTRHRERSHRLDGTIFDAIRAARRTAGWREIDQALLRVAGLGPVGLRVLRKVYRNALGNGNTDQGSLLNDNERGTLTRLNGLAGEIVSELGKVG